MKRRIGHGRSLALAILGLAIVGGCSPQPPSTESAAAGADSVAYAQAMAMEEAPARLTALESLVRDHSTSPWAGRAYPRLVRLIRDHGPERMETTLNAFLKTDYPSPDPYNAVGWDLAEREEHLDLALKILTKAVAKARAAGDSLNLASCLDSEAWAYYKKADYARALASMEEAYALHGPGNDEIDEHMALICDAAGQDDRARELYIRLLGHMENPDLREKLGVIVAESGGSMETIEAEIRALRAANVYPAPDFTLPSLADGQAVSLKDFRGKVVLLNFWHPT